MPADHVHVQTLAALEHFPSVLRPTKAVGTDRTEFGVSIDLDGGTLRIVRQPTCGGMQASRIVVWSCDHAQVRDAEAAYEALRAPADRLQLWSVEAMAPGTGLADPDRIRNRRIVHARTRGGARATGTCRTGRLGEGERERRRRVPSGTSRCPCSKRWPRNAPILCPRRPPTRTRNHRGARMMPVFTCRTDASGT